MADRSVVVLTERPLRTPRPPHPLFGLGVGVAALFAVGIWGGTPVVTRYAVGVMDPMLVAMLRTVIVALAAPLLIQSLGVPRPSGAARTVPLAISALGGFVGFPVLFTLGVADTSASHAGLILAALPLVTGSVAALVERRRPAARFCLGAAVAISGEAALVGFGGDGLAGGTLRGDLLVAASGICAGIGYVAGARLSLDYPAIGAVLWGALLAGFVLAPPLAFRAAEIDWPAIGAGGWIAIAYLAFGASLVAYICWYWALGRGGIARIGAVQFAQPLVTVALAAGFLGEPITWQLILASVFILAGIALVQLGKPAETNLATVGSRIQPHGDLL